MENKLQLAQNLAYDIWPLGDRALVIGLKEAGTAPLWQSAADLARRLRSHGLPWIVDAVPAYDTVTLVYDPLLVGGHDAAGARRSSETVRNKDPQQNKTTLQNTEALQNNEASQQNKDAQQNEATLQQNEALRHSTAIQLDEALRHSTPTQPDESLRSGGGPLPYDRVVASLPALLAASSAAAEEGSRLVEIPVCYGGAFGPDLAACAARSGMAEAEFIAAHASIDYKVALIGFMPGFPYLTGLPQALAQPRRPSPRSRVPAGSVGIAGGQTGIYPLASPGGWQLIGRTPLRLFDPGRGEPSLLRAGDALRFVAVPASDERLRGMAP